MAGSLLLLAIKKSLKGSQFWFAKRLDKIYLIWRHSIVIQAIFMYFNDSIFCCFLILLALQWLCSLGREIRTADEEVLQQKKLGGYMLVPGCWMTSTCLGMWRRELVFLQSSWMERGLDVPERAAKYLSSTKELLPKAHQVMWMCKLPLLLMMKSELLQMEITGWRN